MNTHSPATDHCECGRPKLYREARCAECRGVVKPVIDPEYRKPPDGGTT